MSRLRDLHNFVKYVREVEYTGKVLRFQSNHHEAWKQYAKQRRIPEGEAVALAERAAHEQYIDFKPLNDIDGPPNKVIVSPIKGDDFLEQTFLFRIFPKGLFMAWLEKNYKPLTLGLTFISGVVVTLVVFIVTWYVNGRP